jgi:ATP-dependent protease HslVU (ClpYQ) peptidase subunit
MDAAPDKILAVGTPAGTAYIGSVGFTAHHLVLQDALERLPDADLLSRRGIFDTFRRLHPILQDEYFLLTESGEDGDPYESSQLSLVVCAPTGLFGVYDMREVHEFSRFWAMGSGFAFALGAMHARYETATAAELATLGAEAGCTFDRSSAGPVQTYTVDLVDPPPPRPPPPPARSRARRRRA